MRSMLKKLNKASLIYLNTLDNGERLRIIRACEHIFEALARLGVSRSVSEAYLCFGDEFTQREFQCRASDYDKLLGLC